MLDAKVFTFLEVAEQGSYTRAAERLHLTQPAVTQQIHRLEEHFGRRLVDTRGRSVRLTPAGEELKKHVQIQLVNERRLMQRMVAGDPPLRLGATLSIADYYLPEPLARVLASVQVPQVCVGNTQTLTQRMLAGDLDCALVEGLFDHALFEAHVWRFARFVAAVRTEHPLVGKSCTMSSLCACPLLLREQGSGTRAVLENALFARGMDLSAFSRTMELGSFGLLKAALTATDAVTFLYEGVIANENKLVALDVIDFVLERPLYFLVPLGSSERERCLALLEALEPSSRPQDRETSAK
ncbi:MAG: LysR family transcriptional regulator [Candidatus Limiplasma sp.]|nr:LysR family transcriptional regulator [Candidatus Limiplasma sp.]